LHDLLAEQIAATPDAVAVTSAGTQLTYAELGQRIERLAGHLRMLGVGPETIVGLCAERSLEMIVGIGAVLAAGGAYLPLEPTFPRDRNDYMLGDARPPVVLAQAKFRDLLPAEGFHLHCIDTDDDRIAEPVSPVPGPAPRPENLAYVFYTSGSTGRPKGVMIEHRAIVNRMQWIREAIPLRRDDVVLQKTPFTFDISVCEIFWPLISGARLVMARPGGHTDPPASCAWSCREARRCRDRSCSASSRRCHTPISSTCTVPPRRQSRSRCGAAIPLPTRC
jgi:non-ribosomal peptide synthetase component F